MNKVTAINVLAEKSKANLNIAESWATNADYNSAASRYYYSALQALMYYAVRKRCQEWQKYEDHTSSYSIHSLMANVAGRISPCFKITMLELCQVRRQADYRCNNVSKDDLADILDDVKKLIENALAA